jgi:arylsulfatase A-like enzyme
MAAVSRRQFIAAASAASMAAQTPQRPNFLFIMADDLGYADLSCYGRRDFSTPNLDRLASQGVRFTQAYANSCVCSPTRTALITGRYQYRLPVGTEEPLAQSRIAANIGLPPSHPTLPSLLRDAGYQTSLIGKWHQGWLPNYSPLKSGYDRFYGFRGGGIDYFTHKNFGADRGEADLWEGDQRVKQDGYLTDLLGKRATDTIASYGKSKQPFLMSLHFSAPHWPWEGPEDREQALRLKDLLHWEGGSPQVYARMVQRMDQQIGTVLNQLERSGLARNTVVVFTSDNGGERFSDTWPFSGRKTELLEGGLRVPAIVRWPGRIAAGRTTDQAAMSMDWMPTFLKLAGASASPDFPLDGMDLSGCLLGQQPAQPRKLFWRYRHNAQRALRDGNMKWLEIAGNQFLFDLSKDPMERANLSTVQPTVLSRMAAEFANWNANMLPENPEAYTHWFTPKELADRPGNPR